MTGHLLALLGSGETTPTMVTTHQRLVARARATATGPLRTALLDTPYGFQENAPDITEKALTYFSHNVGVEVTHVGLRRASDVTGLAREQVHAAVRDADWLFCGPGSPSYLLRQLQATDVPALLRGRLGRPGVTVVASAAAVTVGTRAVPVYEIYKVGEDARWETGLDLLGGAGLNAVLVPHYDNSEGGGHDTRFCYLGERRLALLEPDLDDDEWVLGIDEHTALLLDLGADTFSIEGRGGVTVRVAGASTVLTEATDLPLQHLRDAATALRTGDGPAAAAVSSGPDTTQASGDDDAAGGAADPFETVVADVQARFDAARATSDWEAATAATLDLEQAVRDWSTDTLTGDAMDRAVRALRGMVTTLGAAAVAGAHDHDDVLRAPVDLLLELRGESRAAKDWATADRVRDALAAAEVEVRDTPDGTEWTYSGS